MFVIANKMKKVLMAVIVTLLGHASALTLSTRHPAVRLCGADSFALADGRAVRFRPADPADMNVVFTKMLAEVWLPPAAHPLPTIHTGLGSLKM